MTASEFRAYADALVLSSQPHADYVRVCDLARDYRRLATGKDLGAMLRRYEARETPEEFQARLLLTEFVTPAVWSQLMKPFHKVARLRQGVTEKYEYAESVADVEGKVRRLTEVLGRYHGLQSLADYLGEVNSQTTGDTDPNAWVLTEFGAFDYRREQPRPYPVLVPCEAAWDFTRSGGDFTSLTVRTPVLTGHRYTCYLDNEVIDYWPVVQVGNEVTKTTPPKAVVEWQVKDDKQTVLFEAVVLQHRAGRLPAERVGYVPDKETGGRTCISPLHYAAVYLRKSLKLGSEADITNAQVVHPHKAQYALGCPGMPDDKCVKGYNSEGHVCAKCGGTGINPTQTGSNDILQLPYPEGAESKDIVDLSKLVVWNRPPSDIIELQQKILDSLEEKAYRTVFNSEVLASTTVTQTGTEYMDRKAEQNNTLAPFAESISRQFRAHALVVAAYLDLATQLTITHRFPADLKLRSQEELAAALKSARDAGVPAPVLENLSLELVRKQFADEPSEVLKYQVKMRYTPFQGLSDETVLKMDAMGRVSEEYFILRFYQDSVFAEIEQDPAVGLSFYSLTTERQKPIVEAAVKRIAETLPTKPAATPTFKALTTV